MPTYVTVTTDASAGWRRNAACHDASVDDPGLKNAWIDERSPRREDAEEVCVTCPVRESCLSDALADPQAFGLRCGFFFVRGALNKDDNRKLAKAYGMRAKRRHQTRPVAPADQT